MEETGRLLDVETGLQYNRARWYDSSTGRWQSQDPMGFDAGDSNLYRYVNNAPTDATDPSGLQGEDLPRRVADTGKNEKASLKNSKFDFGDGKGEIEVYTGAEYFDKKGKKGTNGITLEFKSTATNMDASTSVHWLQFTYKGRFRDGKAVPGKYGAVVGENVLSQEYGEKGRHVDSADLTGKDPYYNTTSLARRTKNEVTIFDAPQPVQAGKYTYKTFFDSYLVIGGKAVYQVHWEMD